MTGLDYVIFLMVALGAISGFFQGFVQEVLALAAWCIVLFAVHYLHEPLTDILVHSLPSVTGAGVLAFGLLTLLPYAVVKGVSRAAGNASRNSMLGPIDRLLGFGFGAVKTFVIVVLLFSVVVFGYDVVWGVKGRPIWISQARTYPFLNAASEELIVLISERRSQATETQAALSKRQHK
jgi:membrane protein required for colicin V production